MKKTLVCDALNVKLITCYCCMEVWLDFDDTKMLRLLRLSSMTET